jgi:hypothetical protein
VVEGRPVVKADLLNFRPYTDLCCRMLYYPVTVSKQAISEPMLQLTQPRLSFFCQILGAQTHRLQQSFLHRQHSYQAAVIRMIPTQQVKQPVR